MWRGDEQIEEAKIETRRRMNKGQEPNNFFDVLFVVEHPAFAEFYDELMKGGLAVEVGEESDSTSPTGDVEKVLLRDGYEEYDFEIPFIVREAEEELRAPSIDPLQLKPCKFPFDLLKKQIGSGDRFHSHDAQTGTQYGDYRVDGGVMTATGYNDYLSRMTRRIAEALGGDITKSAKKYHEISRFPFLQIQLPLLTGWADAYIRGRLFGQSFAPLENENWRVLLLDDVAHHIASQFATALIAAEENQTVSGAEVIHRRLSEATEITVRASSCVGVDKCIYPKLPYPNKSGGLERAFMEWANGDAGVLAFCKIHEYQHSFLQRRYLKADGFPANYSPDFLVKTEGAIHIVETKSQDGLLNENVQRKQRSALTWCEQINELPPIQRAESEWHYVLLGESAVYEWRDKGAHVAELLEFARVREAPKAQGALSW
jgi:type III restriction enzyme